MTKETIMEKFGDDFDGAVELPELNEQKKQIMLKKMRKTINKLSSLRIQKHMDSELKHMIDDRIEDLKKIKGVDYAKIEGKVQELILSLKQPDFYFADDEDSISLTEELVSWILEEELCSFLFFEDELPILSSEDESIELSSDEDKISLSVADEELLSPQAMNNAVKAARIKKFFIKIFM